MNEINAIILDWAGTAVDYGCFAPVNAFISAFDAVGIKVGAEETRAPMGLPKRKHIEKMLENMGRSYTQEDVAQIYARFEPALFEVLPSHAEPLPGVIEAIANIREMGISIGSTTGYTKAMMDVVVPLAKKNGYAPDCIICPDDTNGIGRPYPYMLWRNLEKLGTLSIRKVLKIGDTEVDMQEGKNAGCLSVGVLKGSSMLAMNGDEETARQKYIEAGADYVIEDISALPALIKSIQEKGV
ncbi:MAG: phosphonoacetaldehyde hydrolase [Fibromonadaceae bacterium]|jgi:phosphonoacetaldehyde hydrolase|nr:phosphonoacetaldehyde hydrolase [Fibromonadaceae bacterium]